MDKRTITTDFFTTLNHHMFYRSLAAITIKLPVIKYWRQVTTLKNNLKDYLWLKDSNIYTYYNWRTALFQALQIIWIKKNDEIIVSWYTCVSVTNTVIQSGWKIIYSDISPKNLWLDPIVLEKNITKKTKVIIIQHTFWKPACIKKIIALAKKYNLLIIEDCAHSLWSNYSWKKVWSFWDFSIFSTWRDKVISSVTWWVLIVNNNAYFEKADALYSKLKMPSTLLTIRNHLYNIIAYRALKTYDFYKFGRFLIYSARKLKLIPEILTPKEKNCEFSNLNLKLPNSLAYLAVKELEKIDEILPHRRSIWEYYDDIIKNKNLKVVFKIIDNEKNNYFRLPILAKTEKQALKLFVYMRLNWVLLWKTWSYDNIVPVWTENKKTKYEKWSCPVAEDISKRILLLPNHEWTTPETAKKVVKLLNKFLK